MTAPETQLLSTSSVLGSLLGAGEAVVSRTEQIPCSHSSLKSQMINKELWDQIANTSVI